MEWVRILAYITGTVDQELLLRNEYLVTENRVLRAQIKGRLLLSDAEKRTLADIGHRLGRQALEVVTACRRCRSKNIRRAGKTLFARIWRFSLGLSFSRSRC